MAQRRLAKTALYCRMKEVKHKAEARVECIGALYRYPASLAVSERQGNTLPLPGDTEHKCNQQCSGHACRRMPYLIATTINPIMLADGCLTSRPRQPSRSHTCDLTDRIVL